MFSHLSMLISSKVFQQICQVPSKTLFPLYKNNSKQSTLYFFHGESPSSISHDLQFQLELAFPDGQSPAPKAQFLVSHVLLILGQFFFGLFHIFQQLFKIGLRGYFFLYKSLNDCKCPYSASTLGG